MEDGGFDMFLGKCVAVPQAFVFSTNTGQTVKVRNAAAAVGSRIWVLATSLGSPHGVGILCNAFLCM